MRGEPQIQEEHVTIGGETENATLEILDVYTYDDTEKDNQEPTSDLSNFTDDYHSGRKADYHLEIGSGVNSKYDADDFDVDGTNEADELDFFENTPNSRDDAHTSAFVDDSNTVVGCYGDITTTGGNGSDTYVDPGTWVLDGDFDMSYQLKKARMSCLSVDVKTMSDTRLL